MAIAKYIEWLFTSMILHYGCSAYDIDRDVCLDKPLAFAFGNDIDGCRFTLQDAEDWFESETGICSQKCRTTLNDLEKKTCCNWRGNHYVPKYQLKFLALSFIGLDDYLMTINKGCLNSNAEKTLKINCTTSFKNVGFSKDLCITTEDCEDESKTCSSPLIGQIGICKCKLGYIGFGSKCLKENLKLNDTCNRDEQCSVAFGSVCQNDTCVCRHGYDPLNDSYCVLSQAGGISQASVRDQKEDNVVSVTVGSLFGGLILGIILTVLTMTIIHQRRHGKPNAKERDSPKVASFNNTTYETDIGKPQRIPAMHPTNERKVVNVPPFAHSVELPVNRNVQEATKRSMPNNDVNVDVYNHLHEKEEDADIDDNYDHAHGNPIHAMGESNYSNLNTGRRNKEPDMSASEDNDYDVQ